MCELRQPVRSPARSLTAGLTDSAQLEALVGFDSGAATRKKMLDRRLGQLSDEIRQVEEATQWPPKNPQPWQQPQQHK
jgi:hypothetical protein